MEPRDPTPHAWLADIYDQMGKKADAEQQRAEAERLGATRTNQVPLAPKAEVPRRGE